MDIASVLFASSFGLVRVGTQPSACSASTFPHNLSNVALQGHDDLAITNTTVEKCLALCCSLGAARCTSWNYHVSSTNPSHHPRQCWLSNLTHPPAKPGDASDAWVGGAMNAVAPQPPQPPPRGGAEIQPLSNWFYYGATAGDTLLRELTDQSVALLRKRGAEVAAIGSNKSAWRVRVDAARAALNAVFAPLPDAHRPPAPTFKIVRTLERPTYTCELLLFETRPGFWATGSLWTPRSSNATTATAPPRPGILLVSGHTPDGFRSNNQFGPEKTNAPGDDDYEVVQINLVARGFVVLAFDPIGQGERMQYADIPQGAPSTDAPWSKGAAGAYLWHATEAHEYIGRQLLLSGVGLMSFWLHDETIALDLLASRATVDATRLGVVGCSGGGTQSSYLAAMDPRVKAASMACYISSFEIDRLWKEGGASDGEQTWPHGIALGLDKADLIEVRADLETQVLITSADTCFPAAGGMAALAEASPAYDALGGQLHSFVGVWHHGWVLPTREQINRFFCDALAPPPSQLTSGSPAGACADATEIDVSSHNPQFLEWTDEELRVTSTGQVVTAPECGGSASAPAKTVHDFSSALADANVAALAQRRAASPVAFVAAVRAAAPRVAGVLNESAYPPTAAPRFLGAQFVSPHAPLAPHPGDPPLLLAGLGATRRRDVLLGVDESNNASSIGLVERWLVWGEGACFATVTMYFPAEVTDMHSPRIPREAVLWYRSAAASASSPPLAAAAFTSAADGTAPRVVAVVGLCGFGETSGSLDSGLGGRGQAAEDMAHEIGRSVPGLHAGEMRRVSNFLRTRSGISTIAIAVAQDYLDVALMHAVLATPTDRPTDRPTEDAVATRIALIAPTASLADFARARIYSTDSYHGWIFGILREYDLADCVAACLCCAAGDADADGVGSPTNVLVLGPTDATHLALDGAVAGKVYAFASEVAKQSGATFAVQTGEDYLKDDARAAVSAIAKWLD